MKISKKAFIAFNLHETDKSKLTHVFMNEFQEYSETRREKIERYLSPTSKTYLLTKTAVNTIENIKFKNTEEFRQMLIDSADQEATILIDKWSFFRYYIDDDGGIACIHLCMVPVEGAEDVSKDKRIAKEMAKKGFNAEHSNKELVYEAFKIKPEEISHPKYSEGIEVPELEFFLKAMVFIKCTNTQVEILSSKKNKVRTKLDGEKYLLEVDQDVTLVNSKYNRIVIRSEQFWVNPHGRFQRHGPGRKLVKYIIIDGYYKNGYKRAYK